MVDSKAKLAVRSLKSFYFDGVYFALEEQDPSCSFWHWDRLSLGLERGPFVLER